MSLPTAANIQSLRIPQLTGTSEATLLTSLIAAADGVIAEYCLFPPASAGVKATLEAVSRTIYLDGPGRCDPTALVLGVRPVTSVTSIKQDSSGDWSYATTESASNYTLDGLTGKVYSKPGTSLAWQSTRRGIQVVCVAGFDTSTHANLLLAIGTLVAYWLALGPVTELVQGQTVDGDSLTPRDGQLPLAVRQLVTPYRLYELEGQ